MLSPREIFNVIQLLSCEISGTCQQVIILGHKSNQWSQLTKSIPASTKHLFNMYTMGRRCINAIQMFCVCLDIE